MLPDAVTLDVLMDMIMFDDLETANLKLAEYHLKARPTGNTGEFEILSIFGGGVVATIGPKAVEIVEDAAPTMVSSTSDERTVNNVMRHGYRVLTDDEKAKMQRIKDMGLEFWELIDSLGSSRELSNAKTRTEEAVMWAVKHLTA